MNLKPFGLVVLLDATDGEVLHARLVAPEDCRLPLAQVQGIVAAELARLLTAHRRASTAPYN